MYSTTEHHLRFLVILSIVMYYIFYFWFVSTAHSYVSYLQQSFITHRLIHHNRFCLLLAIRRRPSHTRLPVATYLLPVHTYCTATVPAWYFRAQHFDYRCSIMVLVPIQVDNTKEVRTHAYHLRTTILWCSISRRQHIQWYISLSHTHLG